MNNQVKEIVFTGPDGKLVGKYKKGQSLNPPVALILHPHPLYGGTMNNPVVLEIFNIFDQLGFSTFRFNFRGVGKSQGSYDDGEGELTDAATAMDWVQTQNPSATHCWVAGFFFGSWIGMQLMMRRPEIKGFISLSAPAITRVFAFLAPCPSSGLFIHGSDDEIVPSLALSRVLEKISIQKGAVIKDIIIQGADHFFNDHNNEMIDAVGKYLDTRLDKDGNFISNNE